MSMLIAYDTNPVIDANQVEEHNQCYLLGLERKAEILKNISNVPQAVSVYNEAVTTLTNVYEAFNGVYPFSSYFKFEASKKVEE